MIIYRIYKFIMLFSNEISMVTTISYFGDNEKENLI